MSSWARTPRSCACGCGHTFTPRNPSHRYAHPTHAPRRQQHPGRGATYRRARAQLFATPPDGAPCPRCGHPMSNQQWATGQLQAGHVHDLALHPHAPLLLRYEHGRCNQSAGATLGNRLRTAVTATRTSRDW